MSFGLPFFGCFTQESSAAAVLMTSKVAEIFGGMDLGRPVVASANIHSVSPIAIVQSSAGRKNLYWRWARTLRMFEIQVIRTRSSFS